jgi:hypothetical protein
MNKYHYECPLEGHEDNWIDFRGPWLTRDEEAIRDVYERYDAEVVHLCEEQGKSREEVDLPRDMADRLMRDMNAVRLRNVAAWHITDGFDEEWPEPPYPHKQKAYKDIDDGFWGMTFENEYNSIGMSSWFTECYNDAKEKATSLDPTK